MYKSSGVTKLSREEYNLLISKVEQNPCLWNDKHVNFKHGSITRKVWKEIGQQVNLTGDECKKKWKNLKDSYRKKVNLPSNKAAKSLKKWAYSRQMKFALELAEKDIFENLDLTQVKEEEEENTTVSENTEDIYENDCKEEDATFLVIDSSTGKRTFSFADIRKEETIISSIDNTEEEKTFSLVDSSEESTFSFSEEHDNCFPTQSSPFKTEETIKEEEGNPKMEENNWNTDIGDDHHFFLSLLPYVRRLDDLEKLKLRSEIQNSVFEAVRDHESKNNRELN